MLLALQTGLAIASNSRYPIYYPVCLTKISQDMVSTGYMTTFFIFMVQDQLSDTMMGRKNNRASQSFRKVCSGFQATTNNKQRCFIRIEPWVKPEQRIVVVVVVLFKVVPQTGVDAFFYTCRRLQN